MTVPKTNSDADTRYLRRGTLFLALAGAVCLLAPSVADAGVLSSAEEMLSTPVMVDAPTTSSRSDATRPTSHSADTPWLMFVAATRGERAIEEVIAPELDETARPLSALVEHRASSASVPEQETPSLPPTPTAAQLFKLADRAIAPSSHTTTSASTTSVTPTGAMSALGSSVAELNLVALPTADRLVEEDGFLPFPHLSRLFRPPRSC